MRKTAAITVGVRPGHATATSAAVRVASRAVRACGAVKHGCGPGDLRRRAVSKEDALAIARVILVVSCTKAAEYR